MEQHITLLTNHRPQRMRERRRRGNSFQSKFSSPPPSWNLLLPFLPFFHPPDSFMYRLSDIPEIDYKHVRCGEKEGIVQNNKIKCISPNCCGAIYSPCMWIVLYIPSSHIYFAHTSTHPTHAHTYTQYTTATFEEHAGVKSRMPYKSITLAESGKKLCEYR